MKFMIYPLYDKKKVLYLENQLDTTLQMAVAIE